MSRISKEEILKLDERALNSLVANRLMEVLTDTVLSYSTLIAPAWTIVEKYRDRWSFAIASEDEELWSCYISSLHEGHYDKHGNWARRLGECWSKQSAAHAICIAALQAKGVIEFEE